MTQPMDPMERQPGVRLEDDVKNPPNYAPDGGSGGATTTERVQEQAEDMANRARDAAGGMADSAREAASGMTESAREAEERGRQQASNRLEEVAGQLRDRAGDGTTGQVAERAAMGMERTAGYLREHSTGDMTADIETYVREHPMQGVAAAVFAGFLIGRVLR